MSFKEINFDGLIGPTHNYAGLGMGNIASQKHKNKTSHPKKAALQGLLKMKKLMELGLTQGFIPPLQRPCERILHQMGFSGSLLEKIDKAYKVDPGIIANIFSASSMWTANAGTFVPKIDSEDNKYHIIPANLASHFHRALEATETKSHLEKIFFGDDFIVHDPLPYIPGLYDEGAANHSRISQNYGDQGIHLFVYGKDGEKFKARQGYLASKSVSQIGKIKNSIFVQQSEKAIDAGAFHNDVINVGNLGIFFCHEYAFSNQDEFVKKLQEKAPFIEIITVKNQDVDIKEVIQSYLFNSQIIVTKDNETALILPLECKENKIVNEYISGLISSNCSISKAEYIDVRQSMSNGGGPACLRFRAQIADEDINQIAPNFILDEVKFNHLYQYIENSYPEDLQFDDLRDPIFINKSFEIIDNLSKIIGVKQLYEFQK